ncbi:MAG: hypothetical protein K2R98_08570 [Gemmataceae bacterium]|nr:hypothetical protein [Gemmataceae bacterium]
MAKKKSDPSMPDLPDDPAEAPESATPMDQSPAPVDAEKSAMQMRIVELERKLALAQTSAPGLTAVPLAGHTGFYEVKLQHAPTVVVEASDPANAWEAYRKKLGVLNSEFSPEIRTVGDDAWLQMHLDSRGEPWLDKDLVERLREQAAAKTE